MVAMAVAMAVATANLQSRAFLSSMKLCFAIVSSHTKT